MSPSKSGQLGTRSSTSSPSRSSPTPPNIRVQHTIAKRRRRRRRKQINFKCGCMLFHVNGCTNNHQLLSSHANRGFFRRHEKPTPFQGKVHNERQTVHNNHPVKLQSEESIEDKDGHSPGDHLDDIPFSQLSDGGLLYHAYQSQDLYDD